MPIQYLRRLTSRERTEDANRRLGQSLAFVAGAANFIPPIAGWVPVPPLSAFVVGFMLYYILAKLGFESRVLEMPASAEEQPAAPPAPC